MQPASIHHDKIGDDINKAAEILTAGGLVSIPTETVYGLAANALNEKAVTRIFAAKNRPNFDPLIVHLSEKNEIFNYVKNFDERLKVLADHFIPGPLTLLLEKKDIIPDLVTSGLNNVAIRIPNHPLTLNLLKILDFPLAAPSANPFGYISPTRAQHVARQLGDRVDYILDGGPCTVGVESTIVGVENDKITIFRKGGIPIEDIENLLGSVVVRDYSDSNPGAPGMLKSHYAPAKKFTIWPFNSPPPRSTTYNIGYLRFKDPLPNIPEQHQLVLSTKGCLEEATRNLFAFMRILDEMDVDEIITELLPETGLGQAINDRLRRAAAKRH